MRELVYQKSNGILEVIQKRWPHAKIEDASDEFHEERFWVEIPEINEKEFWKFALIEGFAEVCFMWIMFIKNPKNSSECKEILNEVLKEVKIHKT